MSWRFSIPFVAVAALIGCEASRSGVGHTPSPTSADEAPPGAIVIVEAGQAEATMGRWFARYAIDKQTRSCWMMIGSSVGQVDCCVMRRAHQARQHVTWETDYTCRARGVVSHPSRRRPPTGGRPAPSASVARAYAPRPGGSAYPVASARPGATAHPGAPAPQPTATARPTPYAPRPTATAPRSPYAPRPTATAPRSPYAPAPTATTRRR